MPTPGLEGLHVETQLLLTPTVQVELSYAPQIRTHAHSIYNLNSTLLSLATVSAYIDSDRTYKYTCQSYAHIISTGEFTVGAIIRVKSPTLHWEQTKFRVTTDGSLPWDSC